MSSVRNVSSETTGDFERCSAEDEKLILRRSDEKVIVSKRPRRKFALTLFKTTSAALFQGQIDACRQYYELFQMLSCKNSTAASSTQTPSGERANRPNDANLEPRYKRRTPKWFPSARIKI